MEEYISSITWYTWGLQLGTPVVLFQCLKHEVVFHYRSQDMATLLLRTKKLAQTTLHLHGLSNIKIIMGIDLDNIISYNIPVSGQNALILTRYICAVQSQKQCISKTFALLP